VLARWVPVRVAGYLAALRARRWARAINAYAQKIFLPRDDKPHVAKSTTARVHTREERMIDFPITELFDDSLCLLWLSRHLHPDGFVCPQCGSANRRRFRTQGFYDAYRCRACDGYSTLLSGTAFEGSRQRPATLVLLLRGITKGESTARLARELQLSRQTVHTLRQRIQSNLNDNAPTNVMR
jgi:transposase-like protein